MDDTQSELDGIAEAYGLGSLEFESTPEKGLSTKNIVAKSSNGTTYFIKKHKRGDLEKIENAEKSAQFVSKYSKVPVLLPVPTSAGESHAIIQDEVYSVFPYVYDSGRPDSEESKLAHMRNLGAMLGMIHSASQGVTLPQGVSLVPAWQLHGKKEAITQFEEIRELINVKETKDEYDEKALAFIDLKISLLQQVELITEDNESQVICHGDYHQANLLFGERGDIIAVCDWDISGRGNPYTELVRSFKMCVIGWKYKQLDTLHDTASAFMEGYSSTCGFELEVPKVESAVKIWYSKLLTQAWPLTDHYYLNHTKTDSSVDSELNKLQFLRYDQTKFVDLITGSLK